MFSLYIRQDTGLRSLDMLLYIHVHKNSQISVMRVFMSEEGNMVNLTFTVLSEERKVL